MRDKIDSGLTAEELLESKQILSKGDSRYWLVTGRMFKNQSAANYSCRFTTLARREHFGLGTSNKRKAAAKAAEIFSYVQANGWDDALARYKPQSPLKDQVTVGDLIAEAERHSTVRPQTFSAYAKAFRRIAAAVCGVGSVGKKDGVANCRAEWQERVNAKALALITSEKVNEWKIARLREAGTDPLDKRRTVVTVNSLLRNAGSLFGRKLLPHIEQALTLPRPLPFEGVTLEKSPSLRYHSKIDAYAVLAKAKEELAEPETEAYKILLLALFCGLRRSEIDNLLWRSFDFANSKLIVESTEYHQLKSEDSTGEIDLDSDMLGLFRSWRAKHPTSTFVIESDSPPKPGTSFRYYRCNPHFKTLLGWLRLQGVDSIKPLHTLRKEIGSIIASEHGIFEASRFLRHSDIRITSAIYADKKKVVTPRAFKGLLGND